MKKELFNSIISMIQEEHAVHKHTVKENFQSYCFILYDGSEYITAFKKARADGADIFALQLLSTPLSRYLTVSYDSDKDKISVGHFETGWLFAGKKQRFYPFNKKRPIICYSKNLYVFHHIGHKPRLMKTTHGMMWGNLEKKIMEMMMQINFSPVVEAPARHAIGAKDNWDIIESVCNIKIPKALKIFHPNDLHTVIKVLKNPQELNSICQYISLKNFKEDIYEHYVGYEGYVDLYKVLSSIMVGETNSWLIRDYFHDLLRLKRKGSLRISSVKRLTDEHAKMSREIMLLGIKEITVKPHYVKMFESFPIEGAELIIDKKRIMMEAEKQLHCVASYAQHINAGRCAIISLPYNGEQWTIEVQCSNVDKDKFNYRTNQVKGFRNKQAPAELEQQINNYFKSIAFEEVFDELPF